MPRPLLVRLLRRLDASPLPAADPVRLELEAELISLMAGPPPISCTRVIVLRADAVRPAEPIVD